MARAIVNRSDILRTPLVDTSLDRPAFFELTALSPLHINYHKVQVQQAATQARKTGDPGKRSTVFFSTT